MSVENKPSKVHFQHDATNRPQVRLFVPLRLDDDFGRTVESSLNERRVVGREPGGSTKVDELDSIITGGARIFYKHDVFWFDVDVRDANSV